MRQVCACVSLAVLFVAAISVSAGEEPATRPVQLRFELTDGSLIVGSTATKSVRLITSYAKMDVPVDEVRALTFGDDRETVSVQLRNADSLTGVLDLKEFEATTAFGKLAIGVEHVRRVTVRAGGKAETKGLVLWNTLGSRAEIEGGMVGPGGTFRGGSFTEGKYGKAFMTACNQPNQVSFPREAVSPVAGCIEFWARLIGFPQALQWGQNPTLIQVTDGQTGFLYMHLNGNDGGGRGGLCASVGSCGSAATGQYGTWSYAAALGSAEIDKWHHYALVWNVKGIGGVDNGTRKAAVFIDGALNSKVWEDGDGRPTPIDTGELRLMFSQGLQQGSVAFDNLKVWNYAKTDFSDRSQE